MRRFFTRNQAGRSTTHRRHEIFQAWRGAKTIASPLDSRHVKAGEGLSRAAAMQTRAGPGVSLNR